MSKIEKIKREGVAQALAGLTYTSLFGLAAVGVSYIGQGTTLGNAGQYFLSGMMLVCAKITNKDINKLGEDLASAHKEIRQTHLNSIMGRDGPQ